MHESAFALAIVDEAWALRDAERIAHDMVLANTGRARRSGVTFTRFPAARAIAELAEQGILPDPMPPIVLGNDIRLLCERHPRGVLILATVVVDEDATP